MISKALEHASSAKQIVLILSPKPKEGLAHDYARFLEMKAGEVQSRFKAMHPTAEEKKVFDVILSGLPRESYWRGMNGWMPDFVMPSFPTIDCLKTRTSWARGNRRFR